MSVTCYSTHVNVFNGLVMILKYKNLCVGELIYDKLQHLFKYWMNGCYCISGSQVMGIMFEVLVNYIIVLKSTDR